MTLLSDIRVRLLPGPAPGASKLIGNKERRFRRFLWTATLAWLLLLGVLVALFELVGERIWPVVLMLYLPRLPWVAPGILLLPFALRRGRYLLLIPLISGGLIWLFPIMGFVLPGPTAQVDGPKLCVLSYNTTHGVDGVDSLRSLVLESHADLVLFQWTSHLVDQALSGPEFKQWHVQRADQFTVASRYEVLLLESIGVPSGSGPPAAHAILDTPIGILDVFNIRPQSARGEIGAARHRGLRQRARELIGSAGSSRVAELTAFRETQIRSIANEVAKARHLVLLAGDTNLPVGSQLFSRYFGSLQDSFKQSGWGLGFTHPAKLPWLRLDRILLGRGLKSLSFRVLNRRISAHRPVLAEITRS